MNSVDGLEAQLRTQRFIISQLWFSTAAGMVCNYRRVPHGINVT